MVTGHCSRLRQNYDGCAQYSQLKLLLTRLDSLAKNFSAIGGLDELLNQFLVMIHGKVEDKLIRRFGNIHLGVASGVKDDFSFSESMVISSSSTAVR